MIIVAVSSAAMTPSCTTPVIALRTKIEKGLKPLDPNDPRVQERRRFFEEFAADHPTEKDWKNYQQWHKLREAA